jgi:phytoene dehydrogenase-like protein
MTERIEAQISRFAPGFREVVKARAVMNTRDVESHNANYIGGDISGGVMSPFETLPYATATKGIYLCSASTAPGAGVHGMCGYHAAETALRRTFGIKPGSGYPRASAAE